MEKAVYILQIVVQAQKLNGRIQKKHPIAKMTTMPVCKTRNRGYKKLPRCGNELKSSPYIYLLKQGRRHQRVKPHIRELFEQIINSTGPHYHPPTQKKKLSEELNDGMESLFRDHGRPLKQANYPPLLRDDTILILCVVYRKVVGEECKITGITQ